jgi:MFS family permease
VPFCAAGLLLAWRGLEPTAPGSGSRLDVTGLALLSPALAALIYALSEAGSHGGFGSPAVIVPLAAGAVTLAAFVLLFLSGLVLYGAMLLLPLYYEQVRGQSPLAAGLLLAPQGLGVLLTRSQAGKLTDRIGARPVVLAGLALTLAGTIPYALAGPHTSEILLTTSLVIRGAGLGGVTIPVMAAAYRGLQPAQVPHASSATRILQQVGGSFGAAVFAMILQTQLATHAARGAAGQAAAFDAAFWWSAGLTAAAAESHRQDKLSVRPSAWVRPMRVIFTCPPRSYDHDLLAGREADLDEEPAALTGIDEEPRPVGFGDRLDDG